MIELRKEVAQCPQKSGSFLCSSEVVLSDAFFSIAVKTELSRFGTKTKLFFGKYLWAKR